MPNELLPCPHCGSEAHVYPDGDMEGYSVSCSGKVNGIWGNDETCCAKNSFAYTTQAEANAAWNTRHYDPLTVNLIIDLTVALESLLYPELAEKLDCKAVNQRAIEWVEQHAK